jgi:hypothetical protein
MCRITRSEAASRVAACPGAHSTLLLAAPGAEAAAEAARMNMYARADWCLPWKRVFRLGLLLQSGAPFDRSSKLWSVLVRIVGPDRSGTWPPQKQRHCGQVWWVYGTFLRRTADD